MVYFDIPIGLKRVELPASPTGRKFKGNQYEYQGLYVIKKKMNMFWQLKIP